jgi:hypothetical protein
MAEEAYSINKEGLFLNIVLLFLIKFLNEFWLVKRHKDDINGIEKKNFMFRKLIPYSFGIVLLISVFLISLLDDFEGPHNRKERHGNHS